MFLQSPYQIPDDTGPSTGVVPLDAGASAEYVGVADLIAGPHQFLETRFFRVILPEKEEDLTLDVKLEMGRDVELLRGLPAGSSPSAPLPTSAAVGSPAGSARVVAGSVSGASPVLLNGARTSGTARQALADFLSAKSVSHASGALAEPTVHIPMAAIAKAKTATPHSKPASTSGGTPSSNLNPVSPLIGKRGTFVTTGSPTVAASPGASPVTAADILRNASKSASLAAGVYPSPVGASLYTLPHTSTSATPSSRSIPPTGSSTAPSAVKPSSTVPTRPSSASSSSSVASVANKLPNPSSPVISLPPAPSAQVPPSEWSLQQWTQMNSFLKAVRERRETGSSSAGPASSSSPLSMSAADRLALLNTLEQLARQPPPALANSAPGAAAPAVPTAQMIATLAALVAGPCVSTPQNVVAPSASSPVASSVDKPGAKRRVSKAAPSGAAPNRASTPLPRQPAPAFASSSIASSSSDVGTPGASVQIGLGAVTSKLKTPRRRRNPPVMVFEFAESPGKHYLFPKDALIEVTRTHLVGDREMSELAFAVYLPPYRGGRPQPMQGVVLQLMNVPSPLSQTIKDASIEKNQAIKKLEKKGSTLQPPGLLCAHYHDVQLGKDLAASLGRTIGPPAPVRRRPTDLKRERKPSTVPLAGAHESETGSSPVLQAVESLDVGSEAAEPTTTPPVPETAPSADMLPGESSAALAAGSADHVSVAGPAEDAIVTNAQPLTASVAPPNSPRTVPPSVASSPKRPPPTDLASPPTKRPATRRTSIIATHKSPESRLPGLSQAVSALTTGGAASRRRRSIAASQSAPATPAGAVSTTPPLASSSRSPPLPPHTTNTSPRTSGRVAALAAAAQAAAAATTASVTATSAASPPSASSELRCLRCDGKDTPMWRRGPDGPKTLCNACGVKFMLGKLARSETGGWIEGKRRGDLFPGGVGPGPGAGGGGADS
ncbi:blue light receptor [Geranomyces variabilis]|uniref:Blue light receptor n=1 Tax=Geranomyces variabilis TaxID=109894 RepID=A0AAD5TMP1_9FUNG|nr:blue light receptor [Geranomyces variabilis]